MKRNTVWPSPVAVATFKQGETVRMSFSQFIGKPVDALRGQRLVCQAVANERQDGLYSQSWRPAAPATDIVHFHVEKDGVPVSEMSFTVVKKKGPTMKKLLAQIRALTIERNSLLEMVNQLQELIRK